MAQLQIPTINGFFHGWASVEVAIAGNRFQGFKSISYEQSAEHGEVRGEGVYRRGTVRGQIKATASGETYSQAGQALLDFLATQSGGIYGTIFDIVVSYGEEGSPLVIDTLKSVRVKKVERKPQEGTDPVTVAFEFDLSHILFNGSPPYPEQQAPLP